MATAETGGEVSVTGLGPPQMNLHSALQGLPQGWEVRVTKDLRPYYVDHIHQR